MGLLTVVGLGVDAKDDAYILSGLEAGLWYPSEDPSDDRGNAVGTRCWGWQTYDAIIVMATW